MSISFKNLLVIPIFVLVGALFWVFVITNEPLVDNVSRSIEESTEYTTSKKMSDPSLFLFSVSQKLEKAIENQKSATYELQKSGDLLSSKLQSNLARTEFIDKRLGIAKNEFIALEKKFVVDPDDYTISIDIASKKNEITSLLLQRDAIKSSVLRTKKQIDLNINNIQMAGMRTIQLETDLSNVQSTDDLAQVLNPSKGSGLSSIGSSEINDLLADVRTLSRYLEGQTDEYLSNEFKTIDFQDGNKIFEEFMNSNGSNSEQVLDNFHSSNIDLEPELDTQEG